MIHKSIVLFFRLRSQRYILAQLAAISSRTFEKKFDKLTVPSIEKKTQRSSYDTWIEVCFQQTQIKIPRCGRVEGKPRHGGKNPRFARSLTCYVRKRNDERAGGRIKVRGREDKRSAVLARKPTRAALCAVRDVPQVFSFPTWNGRAQECPLFLDEGSLPSLPPVWGRICFIRRGNVADHCARKACLKSRTPLRLARAGSGPLSASTAGNAVKLVLRKISAFPEVIGFCRSSYLPSPSSHLASGQVRCAVVLKPTYVDPLDSHVGRNLWNSFVVWYFRIAQIDKFFTHLELHKWFTRVRKFFWTFFHRVRSLWNVSKWIFVPNTEDSLICLSKIYLMNK